jgi:hypothetical protein
MGDWNPWRALRARPHITLEFEHLPAGSDGLLVDRGAGRRVLILAARLTRRERRATLTHELVHDERGILYGPTTPAGLVQLEERAVCVETARRLVPPDELEVFADGDRQVMSWELAEHFDVPEPVVLTAVEAAKRRHPSMWRCNPD